MTFYKITFALWNMKSKSPVQDDMTELWVELFRESLELGFQLAAAGIKESHLINVRIGRPSASHPRSKPDHSPHHSVKCCTLALHSPVKAQ